MGTGLVPIHLFTIIVQSNVVDEPFSHTVPAPVTFDHFVKGVDPDCWAASSAQDLRTKVAFAAVHQIPDVVRTFHPVVSCLLTLLSCFFVCYLLRLADAVRNVLTHPDQLLMAGLFCFFICTHFLPFFVTTISPDCGKLVA